MASVSSFINKIRTAIYGKEVRSSIADGIKAINDEVESTTERQHDLEQTFENLIINAGNNNSEVVAGRYDNVTNENFNTIGARIDSHSSRLEEKAKQSDLEIERARINNLTANAGNTSGNSEIVDIRVDSDGNIYGVASDAVKATTKGLISKYTLYNNGVSIEGAPNTLVMTQYKDDTRTIGVKLNASLTDGKWVYGYSRITERGSDTLYSTLKTKKIRFVYKCKYGIKTTFVFKLSNGNSWGSGDNTVAEFASYLIELNENNGYTTYVDIDLSTTAIQNFFAASQRTNPIYQRVVMLAVFNNNVDIFGNYELSYYAYEIKDDSSMNQKHIYESDFSKKLIGFDRDDYVKQSGTRINPNLYASPTNLTNVQQFSINREGVLSSIYRTALSNPSLLWNYVILSFSLGTLLDIKDKKIYVHFKNNNLDFNFDNRPTITKSPSSWSTQFRLDAYNSSKSYNVYDDLYTILKDTGLFLDSDPVYFCFTQETPAGSGATTIPVVNAEVSCLIVSEKSYTTNFIIANELADINIDEYAKTSEVESIVDEIINNYEDYIVGWGDSLTAQGGWTTLLSTLTGVPLYNAGTGGENARTIMARQGADVMIVDNITIPATTTPVIIASRATDLGIKTDLGTKVTPLLQGGAAHVNPCKIGDIEGVLAWTGSNYADTNGTWTFTRTTVGNETVINRPTAIRTNFDINKNKPKLMILFIGQNGGYTDVDDLINMHRLMIDHSNAKDYIVLGLSSGTASERLDYETKMRKQFGRRFISLREYLSKYGLADAGITPTQDDIDAMALGKTPPSLLADLVHYNDACKPVIGNMLYKKIKDLNML